MKLNENTVRRAVVFSFYDTQGVVDSYIPRMLDALRAAAGAIYIVVNGGITEAGEACLKQYGSLILRQEAGKTEEAVFLAALNQIGRETLANYDEIVFLDQTLMGPVVPLSGMFEEMDGRDLDFWGLALYYEEPRRLQPHFLAVRSTLFLAEDFLSWDPSGGASFTEQFAAPDCQGQAYVHWEGLERYNKDPLLRMPAALLKRGNCPFFKRETFLHDYADYLGQTGGEPAVELMEYLSNETGYDTDQIWETILRTGNMADIKDCLNLDYIVSSRESDDQSETLKKKKTALIYHFYFEDMLEDCLHYAASMPEEADIYITTGTEAKKALLEEAFRGFKNHVEVVLVKNRGRDVSALLVGAKEIVPEYEYICFAHDKKTVHLKPRSMGSSWSYKCFENVLKNRHVVQNIIGLFEKHPRLGLLTSATPNHAYFHQSLGREWTGNFEHVKELAEKLDIHVPMDPAKEPVTPIGSIFWFRSSALKKLFAYDWHYEDFPPEPLPNDESVSHAIERIHGFAVQAAGYYPAWVFCEEGAAVELTNVMHMLRGLNTILFYNKVGAGYYSEVCEKLEKELCGQNKGLTPTLYLDRGNGYSEEETLRTVNQGEGEELKAVFKWDRKQAPRRVRFDPCETGGIVLADIRISLIFAWGGKKDILPGQYSHNGKLSDGGIVFEGEDPWIDISWKSFRKPAGLEVFARVKLQE